MNSAKSAFSEYRSQFPITERYTFMNNAAISVPPRIALDAVMALYEEFSNLSVNRYKKWKTRVEEVRNLVAKLVNADKEEIAFVGNTSEGLGIVGTGIEWNRGDTVIVPEPDFPANIYPWMNLERYGVRLKFVKRRGGRLTTQDISRALNRSVRLVAVSSVDYKTGFLCDLKEIGDLCKRENLLFCVDGIQSLGSVPMDVKEYGIHFLASGGHKWLLGPMGCGFLFISKDVNDKIHPNRVGWKSVVNEEDFHIIQYNLKQDALRFETGTMNLAGIYALGASLELLLELDVKNIYTHIISINELLLDGLKERKFRVISPVSGGERSGILSFVPASDPKKLFNRLISNMVLVSLREEAIRLSPHFYTTRDDVRRFFDVLDKFKDLNK